jgi:hypothetical protein
VAHISWLEDTGTSSRCKAPRVCVCLRRAPGNSLIPGRIEVQRPDTSVERTGRVGDVAGGRVDVAVEDVSAGARSQLDQHVDDALARTVRSGLEHGGPSVGVTSHHDLQTSPIPARRRVTGRVGGLCGAC